MEEVLFDAPEEPDLAGACLAAILAPALATGLGGLVLTIATGPLALLTAFFAFLCALIIAAPYVLVLGLPAYLLVRRFAVPDWRLCGVCGLVLGAAPHMLVVLASGRPVEDAFSAGLFLAVMGLIGGISFRWKLYPEADD